MTAQYRLDNNTIKEYIIISHRTPNLTFSFDIDYPKSHTLDPQGDVKHPYNESNHI